MHFGGARFKSFRAEGTQLLGSKKGQQERCEFISLVLARVCSFAGSLWDAELRRHLKSLLGAYPRIDQTVLGGVEVQLDTPNTHSISKVLSGTISSMR